MTILVPAASGHLGRLVVESLLARGADPAEIVAGSRRPERIADLAERGVRTMALDYADRASVAAALHGVDRVLLVSAGADAVGTRVALHGNVVRAAADAGVELLVYTSAPKATDTTLVLAPEHAGTERLIAESGVPAAVLRNNWYVENYAADLERAAETGVLAASVGDGRVAMATRADYADAAAVVLLEGATHVGAVYELAGDEAIGFDRLAAAMGEALGREVEYRRLTTDEHVATLVAAGLDEGTAGFVAAIDAGIRAGELDLADGTLARLLGRPTTPVVDGLRAILGARV